MSEGTHIGQPGERFTLDDQATYQIVASPTVLGTQYECVRETDGVTVLIDEDTIADHGRWLSQDTDEQR